VKIVFAIKALSTRGGGAERILVEVASGLALRGHVVSVVTCDPIKSASYYPLHSLVHQINLDIGSVSKSTGFVEVVKRMIALRRVIFQLNPDVVIGFMHSMYIPLGLAIKGSGIPLLASEHTGPAHYKTRKFQQFLLNVTPLVAENISVVSEQIKAAYGSWLRRRMIVIPNGVSFSDANRSDVVAQGLNKKILLSVGRLSAEKNHQGLISAFAIAAQSAPDWNLRIIGEGELRNELATQVRRLNLVDKVQLPGSTSNIGKEYANAHLFVLPSSYESFGLATAEALMHGLPAIGFADCAGTNELIRHNVNGLLVSGDDRTQALADALGTLMLNHAERSRLGSASNDWLVDSFGIEGVLGRWENVLMMLRNGRRRYE
jgi:glycosyltransferase involved in cell wall biosynthesis